MGKVLNLVRSRTALMLSMLLSGSAAYGQVDTVQVVVSTATAIGTFSDSTPILAAFGYDPVHDRMYVASGQGINQQLRLISDVNGSQSATTLVYATPWILFGRGGNADYSGGVPSPGGLLLNPQPIPALGLGSFSNAWIMDGASVVSSGSNPVIRHADLTQRLYRFDLETSTSGNASDVFTPMMTLGQFQTYSNTTITISNSSRQFGWSGDGQSLYFIDVTSAAGGIWTIPAAGGPAKRLLAGSADLNTEPAVISSGSIDSIYFRGGASNSGGIDKITYNGTVASARTPVLGAATINDFLELPGGTATISGMAADAQGNLYFNNTGNSRRGLFRLDTQGRLSKVVDFTERQAAFSAEPLTINMLRLQPRVTTFNGPQGTFPVTQLLYVENTVSALNNFVAGAFVFKPGDFNRDNSVDQQDIQLFKSALTPKGVPAATANLKFDLNGNDEVSWKDVKILQQFYPFPDGDANLDRIVNIKDLFALAYHWQTTGDTWTQGDFTGDGIVNAADLGVLASYWQVNTAADDFGSALAAVGLAGAIPEPSILPLFALFALIGPLGRRARPAGFMASHA